MEKATLFENSVLQYVDTEKYIRILWIDTESDLCYVINPDSSKIEITTVDRKDLIAELDIENLIPIEDPFSRIYEYDLLTEKEKKYIDDAYEIIQYIASFENEPICYDRKKRRVLVQEAAQKYGVSEKTVYKYLRKYWQRGKTKGALLSDFYKCGNRGEKKIPGKKKRGKPRNQTYKDGIVRGINTNEEILEIFNRSINKYYMSKKEISLQKTYDLMLKEFFTKKIGGKVVVKGVNEIPSFSQFKNWYYSSDNPVAPIELLESRIGEINTRANYKGISSDSLYEAFHPGYRYQIDATIGDVYLVNRIDRNDVIGRPVVYLLIDTFSRMITGVNVCLEGPSWNGASTAIYNCIEDKVEYCKKYGINIDKEDWNVEGLPSIILGDRGEMVSTLSEGLITLGISVENTPSYMGCAKGIVEQSFRIVNNETKAWLPGEVKKDYRKRGSRDYKLDASLDIEQFTKIVILSVLKRNRDVLKSYPLSQEMIKDNVRPIPIEIWNWGMKNNKGKLRIVSKDILRASLMRKDKATVLRKGIKFNNTIYWSERMEQEKWFSKAQIKGSWKVEIAYDSRSMDTIYIKGVDGRYSTEASIRSRSSQYELLRDKSYDEISSYFFRNKIKIDEFTDEHNQLTLDMNLKIEEIVKEAQSMKERKKNNIKNIKKSRQKESKQLQEEHSLSRDSDNRKYNKGVEETSTASNEYMKSRELHLEKLSRKLRGGVE